MGRPQDKELLPRRQDATKAYFHEGGGTIQDFTEPLEGIQCPGSGQVYWNICGVWSGPQGAPDSTDILRPDYHAIQVWGKLNPHPPLQGIPWSDPRRLPVPHNLQHSSGRRHPPLGDGGGGNVGGSRGTLRVDTGSYGVF